METQRWPLGRRIAVYGPSGSGKSTLARALSGRLELPHIELDALYHLPDWGAPPLEEFRAKVTAVLDTQVEGWVVDGNYSGVRDLVLPRTETAIWLQLPFWRVYPRLAKRTMRRAWTRELLWGTNREHWRDVLGRQSMLVWGITAWQGHHVRMGAALREVRPDQRVIVLRSPSEVTALLEEAKRPRLD